MYDVMALSGGFDPIHKGHVRMIQAAAELADQVVVGVNSDDWLTRKKGKFFMDFEERCEIVSAIRGVSLAIGFEDNDNTAIDLIRRIRRYMPAAYIAFGNGGDRTSDNVPEVEVCSELDVEMVWGVGGGKIQSSSDLVKRALM